LLEKPLQRILGGFIRMHILHHAAEEEICGNWMIEELRRHGYRMSAGTLYPMLRSMEKDGWIAGRDEQGGGRRRFYRITPRGRAALQEARTRLRELFAETAHEEPKART
jgi:DNA-binding PadR family transcriptional regulator